MKNKETLADKLEKWFHKWLRKPVSGRCLVELKEMNKEKIQNVERRIKDLEKECTSPEGVWLSMKFDDEVNKIFLEEIGEGILK